MLHAFITRNREEIIARTRIKVSERKAPLPTDAELVNGVPLFLDQLVEILRRSPLAQAESARVISWCAAFRRSGSFMALSSASL